MRGDAPHPAPDLRHAVRRESPEELEQPQRALERARRRRLEPRECREIALAEATQLQRRPGEVDAANLGLLALGHRTLLGLAPEAQADPGRRPTRPAGALLGGRARDARDLEPAGAAPGVVAQEP